MSAGRFDRYLSIVIRALPTLKILSGPAQSMALEPLCSSSLGLQSLHCGCAWPQPCPGISLGFQLTLKSMCNLLSTCGSLSCHQDPLLSLPCSACWTQMPWDCAQVLSKSRAMGTISYSRGCATVSCPYLASGAQTP